MSFDIGTAGTWTHQAKKQISNQIARQEEIDKKHIQCYKMVSIAIH